MTTARWLILGCWIVFIAYWAVAAIGVKRSVGARPTWRELGLRLGMLVLILLAIRIPGLRHALQSAPFGTERPHAAANLGVTLCLLGMGFAVWARIHLGRNWGMPMSRKEETELVTTGPYAFVRHPIYSGIILAMLGSALGESPFWLLPLFVFGAYFLYSAHREEQRMLAEFPAQYPAYMQRTKMLVPFIL